MTLFHHSFARLALVLAFMAVGVVCMSDSGSTDSFAANAVQHGQAAGDVTQYDGPLEAILARAVGSALNKLKQAASFHADVHRYVQTTPIQITVDGAAHDIPLCSGALGPCWRALEAAFQLAPDALGDGKVSDGVFPSNWQKIVAAFLQQEVLIFSFVQFPFMAMKGPLRAVQNKVPAAEKWWPIVKIRAVHLDVDTHSGDVHAHIQWQVVLLDKHSGDETAQPIATTDLEMSAVVRSDHLASPDAVSITGLNLDEPVIAAASKKDIQDIFKAKGYKAVAKWFSAQTSAIKKQKKREEKAAKKLAKK